MPAVRGVLFDAVGTLFHLREPVGASYARLAARQGVRVPATRLDEAFARVLAARPPNVHPGASGERVAALEREWWRETVRQTFRAADGLARFADFEAFFTEAFEHYAGAEGWQLGAGARQALAALRAGGRRTGVVSNFDRRLAGVLRALGIDELLDTVVVPADCGAAKPDAAPFRLALERLGLAPGDALYVGDRAWEDLEGARRAGLRALALSSLGSLDALPAAVAALEEER